jgi:hypothetical protein
LSSLMPLAIALPRFPQPMIEIVLDMLWYLCRKYSQANDSIMIISPNSSPDNSLRNSDFVTFIFFY